MFSFLSADLRSRAECHEAELLAAMSVDATLLRALDGLLLEVYAVLRPKPADYEQRNALVDAFSKMATRIFGNRHCLTNVSLLLERFFVQSSNAAIQ